MSVGNRDRISLSVVLVAITSLVPIAGYWCGFWSYRGSALVTSEVKEPNYQVQVFKTDPVILYIKDFLSQDEIDHILKIVEGTYQVSRVWGDDIGHIDTDVRASETADVPQDNVVQRIEKRARSLMGWRNNYTELQPLRTQRYHFNDFYSFHYDWINYDARFPGNRMTTFMVYLEADCTGGGTNFPRIPQPSDSRWCNVITCEGDEEYSEYSGVTFKPISGSAIFWENFHANGTPHLGTRHAALPVRSGHKTGLNIWSWDFTWTNPSVGTEEKMGILEQA